MLVYLEVDSFTQKDPDPVCLHRALVVLGVHPSPSTEPVHIF